MKPKPVPMPNAKAEKLYSLLYRAKEILGAHYADLSPLEQEFFKKINEQIDAKTFPFD